MSAPDTSDDAEMGRRILIITVLFLLAVVAAGILLILLSDPILSLTT